MASIEKVIGVIGLGYVGLPLALAFGEKYKTIGFDLNKKRISDLKKAVDTTSEASDEDFYLSKHIRFTEDEKNAL